MQQDNLTLEDRTRTTELAEWVIENLKQDKLYSEIADLEQKIEHNKTYLGSVRLKCDDTSKNFIYKNLNSLLNQFKENKRDKLSKRKEAFNYVKQMIDSDLSQELDLKFLNDEFNVGYATKSNSRCESVVNLLDTIKLYNQYIADLKLKQKLEHDINVDSSCYAARVSLVSPIIRVGWPG